MAAVTELANDVGTSAACQALCMPRASYYRERRKTSSPAVTGVEAFAGTRTPPSGTRGGVVSLARRTLPRSLASRCLCDVTR